MRRLKMAVASDIHLGHRQNPTRDIIKSLMLAFPDNAETADLDIIYLAGDVFDDRLPLPVEEVGEIEIWVSIFLKLCKKHDILVRVLEGTPGHDWQQSRIFTIVNQLADIGADLKYVKDHSIEYIERYGITVLYVPDELEGGPDKTLSQTKELLRAKGLDKVDYAIMHGQFEYQLPPHIHANKHDSAAYLALVRELIFIGHVHTHSRFDRIIAQGSVDRLTHGQEEPKGHVRVTAWENGDKEITFVENTNAKRFDTIVCTGLSIEDTIAKIDIAVKDLPDGSFVRIEAEHKHPIFADKFAMVRRYPTFTWSTKVEKTKEELSGEDNSDDGSGFVPVTITKDNIRPMMMDRIFKLEVHADIQIMSEKILKEIIDGL